MKRTTSSFWVQGLVNMFASQGVDVDSLMRAAHLQPADLANPSVRFGVDQISHLWSLAVQWSGNPALGLEVDLASRFGNFDAVAHVMISSRDLASALDTLGQYLVLISDATTYSRELDHGNSWVSLGHTGNTIAIPLQRSAYGMVILLAMARWLTRSDVQVLAVDFGFKPPADLKPYHAAFACPLRFDQPRSRVLFHAKDMGALLPSRNQTMFDLHARYMQERLSVLVDAPASQRVRDEVARCLSQGEPLRHDIAAKLHISDRTLQRRLHAEGTSFQELLDEVRTELALKCLADERFSLQDIALSLGFVDDSNFYRACKRWLGVSPGQYRKNLVCASSQYLQSSHRPLVANHAPLGLPGQ